MRRRTKQFSMRTRIFVAMLSCVVVVIITFAVTSSTMFKQYEVEDCIEYAHGICNLAADEIDPAKVSEYKARGHNAPGYDQVLDKLYRLRAAYPDVEYLYVYQIQPDGCHVVFDLDTDEVPASEPGEVVDFDSSFSDYLDELLAGKEVEPVISNDTFGYLLTVYHPVYDEDGICQCYVAVDFLMGEIDEYVRSVVLSVAAASAIFLLVFCVAGYFITERRIVRPMAHVEDQAYRDALTGVQNKAAYEERAERLAQGIENDSAVFAILMIDVNYLKRVNDTYGHEKGDTYLKTCCSLMCDVFGTERVYRFGGDEFLVVLEGNELVHASDMLYDFKKAVRAQAANSSLNEWERVSAAAGMAVYDPKDDDCVQDVLKRADNEMYQNKKAMKAQRTD